MKIILTRKKFETYYLIQEGKRRNLTDEEIIEIAKSMFHTFLSNKDFKGIRKNEDTFHYLEIFEKLIWKYINR